MPGFGSREQGGAWSALVLLPTSLSTVSVSSFIWGQEGEIGGKFLLALATSSMAVTVPRMTGIQVPNLLWAYHRATPQHCSLMGSFSSSRSDTPHSAIAPTLYPQPMSWGASLLAGLPVGRTWARLSWPFTFHHVPLTMGNSCWMSHGIPCFCPLSLLGSPLPSVPIQRAHGLI